MATELSTTGSLQEIRTRSFDFSPDLVTGVTLVSATATHTPPSGAASTPIVAIAGSVVEVTLGPLSVNGDNILDIVATLSDGETSEIRLHIWVGWKD